MKNILYLILLMLFSTTPAMAKSKAINSTGPYLFKANEVSIYVPSPTDKFVEAGYVSSGFLWEIVRDKDRSNGLFVLKTDFNHVMDGVSNADIEYSNLSKYARVQVRDKDINFDPVKFKEAVDRAKAEVGDPLPSDIKEPRKTLIKRMKALDLKSGKLKARTSLGRLFSKPDAYSYGVLIKEEKDGKTSYVLAGFTMVRVNGKMLSTYLYTDHKGIKTLEWLQETTELWSDSILKTNQ